MTFGHKTGRFAAITGVDQAGADALVKRSVEAGINFIDTANIYSEGVSEEITGQAVRNLGLNRDDMVIATKVRMSMGSGPNDSGLTRKHIVAQCEASLKRLKMDYIDLYQTHAYDPITPWEETLGALDDLVRAGKVRYIGASNVAAWQLMKALGVSERDRLARYQSLQAYYTLAGRDLERELVPLLQDQRLGLMVWSPLAGGLLSGKYSREDKGDSDADRRAKFDFPPVDKDRAFTVVDALRPMAEARGASVASLALAWLLHQPAVNHRHPRRQKARAVGGQPEGRRHHLHTRRTSPTGRPLRPALRVPRLDADDDGAGSEGVIIEAHAAFVVLS